MMRKMWNHIKVLLVFAVVGLDSRSSSASAAVTVPIGVSLPPPSPRAELQLPLTDQSTPSLATERFHNGEEQASERQRQPGPLERYRSRVSSFQQEPPPPVPSTEQEENRDGDGGRPLRRRRRRRWRPGSKRTAWTVPQGQRHQTDSETRRRSSKLDQQMKDMRTRFRSSVGGMRRFVDTAAGNHAEVEEKEDVRQARSSDPSGPSPGQRHQTDSETRRRSSKLDQQMKAVRTRFRSSVGGTRRLVKAAAGKHSETRLQRTLMEKKIQGLRREWSDRKAALRKRLGKRRPQHHRIPKRLRAIAGNSKILSHVWEELLSKKQPGMDTSVANEETFRRALELILEDTEKGGWERVASGRDGELSVHRKFIGKDSGGSKFACVRARCSMDVPAAAVAELFESPERIKEYNKWFLDGRDLELLDEDTRVVWASSPSPLPFVKPRDFVTVVNVRRLEDGTVVIVNRGHRHPDAPPRSKYVRGEVILGAHVMRPDAKDKNKTHFTLLTQVDPGGVAPAWIVNKISSLDTMDYIERVEVAAGRSKAARR